MRINDIITVEEDKPKEKVKKHNIIVKNEAGWIEIKRFFQTDSPEKIAKLLPLLCMELSKKATEQAQK